MHALSPLLGPNGQKKSDTSTSYMYCALLIDHHPHLATGLLLPAPVPAQSGVHPPMTIHCIQCALENLEK